MKRATKQLGMIGRIVSLGLVVSLFLSVQLLLAQTPLDPLSLTKYSDPLPKPGKLTGTNHVIGMYPISQYLHKDLELAGKSTALWGYGTSQATATYPGPTIEAKKGTPIQIKWENHLPTGPFPASHMLPVDPTLHMAMPINGIPAVVHLHGGETEPQSDGHPDAWFTPGFAEKGIGWKKETFYYHNQQLPATLWYHDHALGITRLNVYAGLAGFYLLRDEAIEDPLNLPEGDYEREIVIQDRILNDDGSLHYPVEPTNPTIHPIWGPEMFGDIIVVNGKAWPYLNVEPRKYRFRVLNGSNARFYHLSFDNGLQFQQIGTDGGYLRTPVPLTSLLIAPGERAELIVDFSSFTPGTELLWLNDANAPYPDGDPVDPSTTGQIMKFVVVAGGPDGSTIPANLISIPTLTNPIKTRSLTLNEVMGPGGPIAMFLDGKMWDAATSELPALGSTEVWEIINMTADTHPIHLHLTQFQLLNRQSFDAAAYMMEYDMMNPVIPTDNPVAVDVTPYLIGSPVGPDPNEDGWKDTFRMNPGEVTRVIVRFQPNSAPLGSFEDYAFDATAEPGYVWHCHILEHEDNEMMRPYKLTRAKPDYVFIADKLVKINQNKESDGNIHSNGKIEFGKGAPGTHTGNLTARDDITIRTWNTIVGNAKAGDELYLFGNANVTGVKASHANVEMIPLPKLWFTAGGANVTVPKNGMKTLLPGSYNIVTVRPNGTLHLSAGDYYMKILDTDASAKLHIDVSNGPVKINVVKDLDIAPFVQVMIMDMGGSPHGGMGGSGSMMPSTYKVTFVTLQDPKVDIGKNAVVLGTLIAQDAEIHFSTGSRFKGSAVAEKITLDPNVKFQHHDSMSPVPKESAPATESELTSTVTEYELAQNYPNPFNPSTTISFALPQNGQVKLAIYDLTGQLVKTLVYGDMPAGSHRVVWNGKNEHGNQVASGVYLYKLQANGFVAHKKLILMK